MTPAASGNQWTSVAIVFAIIALVLVRRTYAIIHGAKYTPSRLFVYSSISAAFFAFFGASTLYVAVGTWGLDALALVAPYVGVVVACAILVLPRVEKLAQLERRPDGSIFFRLPAIIPITSVLLFCVRALIQALLFGAAAFTSLTLPSSLPTDTLVVVIGFDLLYGVSIGLLFGRAFGVRAAVRKFEATTPPPPAPLAGA